MKISRHTWQNLNEDSIYVAFNVMKYNHKGHRLKKQKYELTFLQCFKIYSVNFAAYLVRNECYNVLEFE